MSTEETPSQKDFTQRDETFPGTLPIIKTRLLGVRSKEQFWRRTKPDLGGCSLCLQPQSLTCSRVGAAAKPRRQNVSHTLKLEHSKLLCSAWEAETWLIALWLGPGSLRLAIVGLHFFGCTSLRHHLFVARTTFYNTGARHCCLSGRGWYDCPPVGWAITCEPTPDDGGGPRTGLWSSP